MDAAADQEATVDYVDARPLLDSGLNVGELPARPVELGAMTPGQWYYLGTGKLDPHHGRAWDFPMLLRAGVVKSPAIEGVTPRIGRRPGSMVLTPLDPIRPLDQIHLISVLEAFR